MAKIIEFPGGESPERGGTSESVDPVKALKILETVTLLLDLKKTEPGRRERNRNYYRNEVNKKQNAQLIDMINNASEEEFSKNPAYFSVVIDELRLRDLFPR